MRSLKHVDIGSVYENVAKRSERHAKGKSAEEAG